MDLPDFQEPRDLEYEVSNRGPNAEGIKCRNFEFCGEVVPEWWWSSKGRYLCSGCYMDWCRKLEFREPAECPVCLEVKPQMKFPGNCNHWFCCSCVNAVVYGLEVVPATSPVRFGCPPCPNGCTNPVIGPQCNCEEYKVILNLWKNNRDYQFFIEMNTTYIEATDKCPLCRDQAIYKDWGWKSYGLVW